MRPRPVSTHARHAALGVLLLLTPALLRAASPASAGVLSFEESALPAAVAADAHSTAAPSTEHAKYGAQSLRWDWQPGGVLTFHHPIAFKALTPDATSNALSTFVVWIYNPVRRPDGKLRFAFGRGGERDCWFDFGLDFTGWRTCWVAYERDMQGKPRTDMDTLRIVAPESGGSGTVFIDSLVFSQPIDARHATRDRQVPFVGTCLPTDANDHWLGLWRFDRAPLPDGAVTPAASAAVATVTQRYTELLGAVPPTTPALLANLQKRFATWKIRRTPAGIRGRPIAYPHEKVAYPAGSVELAEAGAKDGLQSYATLLFGVAQASRGTTDETQSAELRRMFFDLTDHLLDQGWADGSGMGTLHHLGYSTRHFYAAFFLMRDALRDSGRLEEVQRMMAWFSGVGKAYVPLDEVNGISIDTLNTTLLGQIAAQLLMPDDTRRVRALTATSHWLGRALEPSQGLNGGIKADGSILHHGNHYPAYAEGGIRGATEALWLLANTPLRVPEAGHASLRRAMLNLRFQCNVLQWPLSLSGRHPNAEFSLSPEPYLFLALSGTPDGRASLDREVAEVWRRLADADAKSAHGKPKLSAAVALYRRAVPSADAPEDDFTPALRAPIAPEAPPTGNLTLSYATTVAHRRANWLVTARGFSRYLWGSEVYPGANTFGRYNAYGHVEILAAGDPINLFDSGFAEAGWDWNCWPGTTAIHLPIDLLRDRVNNVDIYSGFEEMLISDEAFAGGSNLGGRNGVFAMKLHEHAKYDGSFRARKSVFFFDDRVVLLGSDITDADTAHETRTTLFQQHVPSGAAALSPDRRDPAAVSVADTIGNVYYVFPGSTLRVTTGPQSSRSQNDKRDTTGDFALAWLDHGSAPKSAGYAYAILVQPSEQRRSAFTAALRQPDTAPFTILRRDHDAHIVRDRATGILAAACFEPINHTGLPIAAVDTPAIVMLHIDQATATLSVCDPDLHLYAGTEADQYDAAGRQREVSIYSRKWFRAASAPSRVRVTVVGDYRLAQPDARVAVVAVEAGQTTLELTCRDGQPVEVALAVQP
ncbi:hypothetical protein K0B96_16470 [Horticoccus luteus]|uniref:Chondroitin ABC lyase n=1 Tax=Horticoccus luteus TaxID=2862869 RepID=A0A8F9XG80_9BACT|nr:chondroitinase family polysaccharide lyase [Horticoccus luteus]QYM78877.1 hypothetical protein K0B96_16470 [Horticoccus luteus]